MTGNQSIHVCVCSQSTITSSYMQSHQGRYHPTTLCGGNGITKGSQAIDFQCFNFKTVIVGCQAWISKGPTRSGASPPKVVLYQKSKVGTPSHPEPAGEGTGYLAKIIGSRPTIQMQWFVVVRTMLRRRFIRMTGKQKTLSRPKINIGRLFFPGHGGKSSQNVVFGGLNNDKGSLIGCTTLQKLTKGIPISANGKTSFPTTLLK